MAGRAKLKSFDSGECSDEFRNAFAHSSSISVDCTACGRTHFYVGEDADWDSSEGEHASLLRRAKMSPDRYIAHDDDSIRWADIFGRQVVMDCPCGFAAFIEKRFWEERFDLMSYFKARATNEKEATDHMVAEAQAAEAAVES